MIALPFLLALIAIALSGIRIAQEYQRAVVFRLGRFQTVKGPGIYYLVPLIDRQQKVDIRVKTVDLERQETITKDSVTIKVNAVLWFRIINPESVIIKVADYNRAVYQFAVSALRNIIGQHSLDEVLKEREQINNALQKIVDQTTEPWGIKIEMVEMKDVEIPEGMQRAMAREAEAIREKRARIVKAEAELDASIKLTQGAKEMESSPIALELRRMQMLSEIGIDNNTTTIVLVPSDFTQAAKSFTELVGKKKAEKTSFRQTTTGLSAPVSPIHFPGPLQAIRPLRYLLHAMHHPGYCRAQCNLSIQAARQ